MTTTLILWIYIALLLVGGTIGFVKGKSKISLIASLAFAIALSLCALHVIPEAAATGFLGALILVFGIRLAKTRKFMPSGMMLIVTILTVFLWFLVSKTCPI